MSEIKDGGPAFPLTGTQWNPDRDAYEVSSVSDGMTLRDYFAAKAMDACVSAVPHDSAFDVDNVARFSYTMADAMLRARSQS
jgi:hypothetical protein